MEHALYLRIGSSIFLSVRYGQSVLYECHQDVAIFKSTSLQFYVLCGWWWKADISLLFSHNLTSRLELSLVFWWYEYLPIIYGKESWEIFPIRALKSPRTITKLWTGIEEMTVCNSSQKLSLDSNQADSVRAYADVIVICGLQCSVMVIIWRLIFVTCKTQLARWLWWVL